MAEFENFGFYTIDADYLEYLNSKNSEVYYNVCGNDTGSGRL